MGSTQLASPSASRFDGSSELARGFFSRVGIEDAGLSLDHLAHGPVRHSLAVRKAAALAPVDQVGIGLDALLKELEHEPALSDPGDADEGDKLWFARRAGAGEGVDQDVELAAPPDQRRAGLKGLDVDASAGLERLPDCNGLGLALGLDGLGSLEVDRVLRRPVRRLVHEDAVDRRGAPAGARRC